MIKRASRSPMLVRAERTESPMTVALDELCLELCCCHDDIAGAMDGAALPYANTGLREGDGSPHKPDVGSVGDICVSVNVSTVVRVSKMGSASVRNIVSVSVTVVLSTATVTVVVTGTNVGDVLGSTSSRFCAGVCVAIQFVTVFTLITVTVASWGFDVTPWPCFGAVSFPVIVVTTLLEML